MLTALRLMAVLAHPDDESLGLGGALVKYASEGVEVSVVMATRSMTPPSSEPRYCRGREAYAGPRDRTC